MTFVRTLNSIIDEMDGVEHGDSVLACLNNITGAEPRFETTDDAMEYLVKQYVEGGEGPVIWDLDIPREGDPVSENVRYIRNCTYEQFTADMTANGPGHTILRDTHLADGKTVYASYRGTYSGGSNFTAGIDSRTVTYAVSSSPWTHDEVTDLVVSVSG